MKKGAKKGLSIEEKIERVEKWFRAHPAPFVLKELLSVVPKATGVLFQSIPDVLELLVSEYRVFQEKIGVQTLFWYFPATPTQQQQPKAGFSSHQIRQGAGASMNACTADQLQQWSDEALLMAKEEAEGNKCRLEASFCTTLTELGFSNEADVESERMEFDALLREKTKVLRLRQSRRGQASAASPPEALTPALCRRILGGVEQAVEAAIRWTDNFTLLEEEALRRGNGLTSAEVRNAVGAPAGDLESLLLPELIEALEQLKKKGCDANRKEEDAENKACPPPVAICKASELKSGGSVLSTRAPSPPRCAVTAVRKGKRPRSTSPTPPPAEEPVEAQEVAVGKASSASSEPAPLSSSSSKAAAETTEEKKKPAKNDKKRKRRY